MTPTISIIVPVYNAERWIRRCLDSIITQSFSDFEAVCVNDASTDSSLAILKEYALHDSRIHIVDLPVNRGEGGARNAGLQVARGTYIGFVDSDDTIDTDFYESLHSAAAESGADMVCAQIRQVDQSDRKYDIPYHTRLWNSLFRTEFLKKNAITFPAKYSNGDDGVFMGRVFLAQPLFHKVDGTYYNYFQISSSASHSPSEGKCQACTDSYCQIFSEIEAAVRANGVPARYAQTLFSDFLQGFLRFIMQRYTDKAKHQAAEVLIDLFARYPYRAEAESELKHSDPELFTLLQRGNVDLLAAYLQAGKQRLADELRARMKKLLSK